MNNAWFSNEISVCLPNQNSIDMKNLRHERERQAARGESRERAKCQRETLGKYFYDLSKLTFTALVLGGIAMLFQSEKIEISMIGMFMVGILFSVGLAFCGNKILK